MATEMRELTQEEMSTYKKWRKFRTLLTVQRVELMTAKARVARAKRFRDQLDLTTKVGAATLSWGAALEAQAYNKLRLLPSAWRFSAIKMKAAKKKLEGR